MELWDQIRSSPSSKSREGLPWPRVVGSKGLGERALGREAGVGEIRPPVMLSTESRGEAGKGDRGQQRLGRAGRWRHRCGWRVMPGKVKQEDRRMGRRGSVQLVVSNRGHLKVGAASDRHLTTGTIS